MSNEHNLTYKDQEILVDGDYIPGEPGVHTYPSGDPGYPPSPAEFYINRIMDITGRDITDLYSQEDFAKISEIILEGYE